jgi:hypothetical protein
MNPLSFGIMGLALALFANALPLLGIDAAPLKEGGHSPGKTVAVVGSLAGAITLTFFALWFIIKAPFGMEDPVLVRLQILFASLGGKFGLLWIGVTVAQILDWDLRPVGTMCLLLALIHVIEMIILPSLVPVDLNIILIEVVFASYVLVLLGFWAVTHGKIAPKPVGWILLIATVGTLYIQFVASGVVLIPGVNS